MWMVDRYLVGVLGVRNQPHHPLDIKLLLSSDNTFKVIVMGDGMYRGDKEEKIEGEREG